MDGTPGWALISEGGEEEELAGKLKKIRARQWAKQFKTGFIQCYCNWEEQTSAENWFHFQIKHGQVGIYGQGAGGRWWMETTKRETSGVREDCGHADLAGLSLQEDQAIRYQGWKVRNLTRYQGAQLQRAGALSN